MMGMFAWIFGILVGAAGMLFYMARKVLEQRQHDKLKGKTKKFFINLVISNKKDVVKEKASEKLAMPKVSVPKTSLPKVSVPTSSGLKEKITSSFPTSSSGAKKSSTASDSGTADSTRSATDSSSTENTPDNIEAPKHKQNKSSGSKSSNLGDFIIGGLANKSISDDKFTEQVGLKVAEGIKPKFAAGHIDAYGELVYVKKCYAVICATVNTVDAKFILSKKVEESKLETILKLLAKAFGQEYVDFAVESQVTEMVMKKIEANLAEDMMKKLKNDGGVEAEVVIKSSNDQGVFFFNLINITEKDGSGKGDVKCWKLLAANRELDVYENSIK